MKTVALYDMDRTLPFRKEIMLAVVVEIVLADRGQSLDRDVHRFVVIPISVYRTRREFQSKPTETRSHPA